MAASLVVVDVGNTTVKVVAFDAAGAVLSATRAAPGERPDLPEGPLVAVSVSDRNLAALERVIGLSLPILDPGIPAPPGTGTDRLCAAVAAHARAGGAAVAAGVGTAATVDAVNRDGAFLGGAIAPGLRSAAAGLSAAAPRLPVPGLDPGPVSHPGRSTADALRAGHLLGFAGLVDRLVEEAVRAAGGGEVPVFLHGGDAEAVGPLLRSRFTAAPHLVAEGARLLHLARS